MTLLKNLDETVAFIKSRSKLTPDIGLTLGSGLAHFVDHVEVEAKIPFAEIPHFSPSKVVGHPGQLVLGRMAGKSLAILQGRIHYYEGHSMQQVVYPTRALARLGVRTQIITNAAGGIGDGMTPGHLMIIKDHINLTGDNPLRGENFEALGTRFPDMSEPYKKNHIQALEKIMRDVGVPHSVGIYCGVQGPCYETAAEVRYLRSIGGHAVGMSTVPEVIAARHMNVDVVGLSCITNLATGMSDEKISHADVTVVAKKVEAAFTQVLKTFIAQLGTK